MQQHNNEQSTQMVEVTQDRLFSAIKGNEETSILLTQLAGILDMSEHEIIHRLCE